LLCVDTPTEVARQTFDPGQAGFAETGFAPAEAIPAKPPVDRIVISQDVTAVLAATRAALEAHRTQVTVSGACVALSNGVGQRIGDHEYYSIGAGAKDPEDRLRQGPADHVLSGLDLAAVEARSQRWIRHRPSAGANRRSPASSPTCTPGSSLCSSPSSG